MFKLHSGKLVVCGLALALPALTQAPPNPAPGGANGLPATCNTAPTSLTAFSYERTLNFGLNITAGTGIGAANNQSGVFTTYTPSISPLQLPALLAGTQEVREQASLNTNTNVLTVRAFTAAPGSQSPTPGFAIQAGQVLWSYEVQVTSIQFSCRPVPTILMTGTISNNFPLTPFGSAIGALVAVGIGYTTDNPPKLNNVVMLVPGLAGLYSPGAVGTLTFPAGTVNPPGTAGNAPVIVFSPSATQQVFSRQLQLDASGSKDPNGLQLTYSWTQVNTNIAAGIANANTATPLVTFSAAGDYIFQVSVTNSKGIQNTAQTTITYYGR